MVKMSETKPGRRDGSYARIFDHADLGSVLARVHATTIRAGVELERIIRRESRANENAILDLDTFLDNGADGIFIADKSAVKASSKIQFKDSQPDYLIFERQGALRRCYVMELKDGDTFDTKKASGEVSTLTDFSQSVGSTLSYATEIRVCSFNQTNKQAIVTGFKQEITEDQAWTGREFCELVGFDYDAIVNERRADAEVNRKFLVEQLLSVPEIREIVDEALSAESEGECPDE